MLLRPTKSGSAVGRIGNQAAADAMLDVFIETRSVEAEAALVNFYADFAHSIAHKMSATGPDKEDIEQIALVALLEAIRRFDPEHGVKITTFAYKTIEGAIKRYFRDHRSLLRAPRGIQERSLAVRNCIETLTQDLKRSPTISEIANRCSLTEEDVIEALEAARTTYPASIEGGGSNNTSLDLGNWDPRFTSSDVMLQADRELDRLDRRDRRIFELRFFCDLSQSEIAKEMGVSQMQISRVLSQICARLRNHIDDTRMSSTATRVMVAEMHQN